MYTPRHYMTGIVIAVALTAATLGGCKKDKPQEDIPHQASASQQSYSFNDFNMIAKDSDSHTITSVFVADLDGDGALDIITGDQYGKLQLYRNDIPQKKPKCPAPKTPTPLPAEEPDKKN